MTTPRAAADYFEMIRERYEMFRAEAKERPELGQEDHEPLIAYYTPTGEELRVAEMYLHEGTDTLQIMAAEGLLTFEELRAKLADLEDTRKIAERELKVLRERVERIEVLEQDNGTLLASFGNVVPGTLDELTPEKRNQLYKMLKLRLIAGIDGSLRLEGVFCEDLDVHTSETTS